MAHPDEQLMGKLDAEAIRENISVDEIRLTIRYVSEGRCQCCGGDPDEMLACGHRRCEFCRQREHECIACAVAT